MLLIRGHIGDEGATFIASALHKTSTLTSVNLSTNNIHGDGANSIAQALKQNQSITELNLSFNDLGSCELSTFSLLVSSKLKVLKLSHCGLEDTGATALFTALIDNQTLTLLDLSENHVSVCHCIANTLGSSSCINELYLTSNRIEHEVALQLCQAATTSKHLQVLDLRDNLFSKHVDDPVFTALVEDNILYL